MPRREIQFSPGHYYHAFNRGAGRAPIFFRPDDYQYCRRLLERNQVDYQVQVISYCLMPNHYHLLLRQDGEQPISDYIAAVFNPYVQSVNKQQGRHGTLFQGRFRARWVADEAYLDRVSCYIHANPLVAGLIAANGHWPYSNLAEWVGKISSSLWDRDFVQTRFPESADYLAFLDEYLANRAILPSVWRAYLDWLTYS